MKILSYLSLVLVLCLPLISCGSSAKSGSSSLFGSSRKELSQKVLEHPNIRLMRGHVSGKVDTATAYHNIASTARGYSARLSSYGRAPGGYTKLDTRMLKTMLYIANKGWTYHVTEIAGGSHSRNSRHYVGVAFDVDRINGVKVRRGNPYMHRFMSICRKRGATEVLGPGDRGHNSHIHIAWPR